MNTLNMFNTVPQAFAFRARNNSGGSTGSSVSSFDSDLNSPTLPLGAADIQTIANLLSVGGSSVQMAPPQQMQVPATLQQVPPPQAPTNTAAMQQLINSQMAAQQQVNSLQPEQLKNLTNSTRYKTELCRSSTETGFCKYGDKCQFAHGNFEIKAMPRHPKYKSDLCRTFHTTGLCPYGPRCHFIHSEDESKLTEINLMKQQAAARQATQQMLQQASRLRAQQQALQAQMQALMISQVHLQIAQKQLPTKPVYQPQMSLPAHATTIIPQHQQPTPVYERTTSVPVYNHHVAAATINQTNNVATLAMGSTMDTPPVTPPCGSPTFNTPSSNNDVFTHTMIPSPTYSTSSSVSSSKVVSPPPGFAPRSVASSVCSSISSVADVFEQDKPRSALNLDFNFQQNLDNEFESQMSDAITRLSLNSVDLESLSSFDMYTPSVSPDSNSPLDSPRSGSSIGSRLPVFSQFA